MTRKTAVRTIDAIEVEMGSGNVFADLGPPDADKLKIKSGLAATKSETLAQRKAQFVQAHGAWIAEQNQRFEAHGLWCDDMRVW
jgi:hypothetical protein